MAAFIGVGVNSATSGVESVAIVDFIPFVSENLGMVRNDLPDPSLWTNFDERRMYNGLQRIEGGIQTVVHPLLTPYFCRAVFDTTTTQAGWLQNSVAGVRAHRFTTGQTVFQAGSGSDVPTLTLELNRGPLMGSGSSFMYYGLAGNTMELTMEAGQLARANFEFLGRDYGNKSRSTPSFVPAEAFLWNTASVSQNSAAKPYFETLTVRAENNLEAVPTLDGRLRPDLIKRNDFRRVMVNGTISFRGHEDKNDFENGSETPLRVTFTGKNVHTAATSTYPEMLDIFVPRFRYSTFPVNAGGPGRISVGFTGRGMIDPTSNYSLEITFCNTRISGYHVNTTA